MFGAMKTNDFCVNPLKRINVIIGADNYRKTRFLKAIRNAAKKPPILFDTKDSSIIELLKIWEATMPSKSGVVIIDEIATGLHHSKIESAWKMLFELSGFQIFVTTHSLDALISLSALVKENATYAGFVAIHRIDKDAANSVYYSAEELNIAMDQGMEIR